MASDISVKDNAVKKKIYYWLRLGLNTKTKGHQDKIATLKGSVADWKKRLNRMDRKQGREQMDKMLNAATSIIEEIRNEIRDL